MFKKKPYKERISKLMNKIKIRINMKNGEESNHSQYEIQNLFPVYGRAIKRLSNIQKIKEEVIPSVLVERQPEITVPMTRREGALRLIRCGGGHMVRKIKKRSDRA